jgi:SAM-dependent methyltransferase
LVLDLGGIKIQKRGSFDINRLNHRVVYVNLSNENMPDIQADAASLPFGKNIFDVVVCAELLEHVYLPELVLREMMRVLKPNGILLITVPFLVPYHADPCDFGRYSSQYLKQVLKDVGFSNIQIEKQGDFWSVLLDMLRGYVIHLQYEQCKCMSKLLRFLLKRAIIVGRKKVLANVKLPSSTTMVFFEKYTTGFGILAIKQ